MAAKPHALQKNWGCAATASLHTPNFLNEQRAFQKFGMTHGLLTELILCGGQTPGSFSLLGGSGRVSSEEQRQRWNCILWMKHPGFVFLVVFLEQRLGYTFR